MKVVLIILFTSTDIRLAVSKSRETARMAIPILVFLTMNITSRSKTKVTTGIRTVSDRKEISPILIFHTNCSGRGNGLGRAPITTMAIFCRRKDTPIADISTDIRGAFLKGRYATFSMLTPRMVVKIIAIIKAQYQGNANTRIP